MSRNEEIVKRIECEDERIVSRLSGVHHNNLRRLAEDLNIRVGARGTILTLKGASDAVGIGQKVVLELLEVAKKGRDLVPADFSQAIKLLKAHEATSIREIFTDAVFHTEGGKHIAPKGPGQQQYVHALRSHDMVFAVGPAGTGKTYLAMATAVAALRSREVIRIILARPAVEAGEKLGFLPGTLEEKVLPYLRPLYDALYDLLGAAGAEELIEHKVIELAPLAYMRGRTLNDAFVILDEAQNTTPEQMKMFLTRLGFGSKMVITGDVTQIDLKGFQPSGLIDALEVLNNVEGIAICRLTEGDVVRHPLVQGIVKAYDRVRNHGQS